jgi:Ser/Thr protein kinase RdoA (MazF antagonist)
MKPYNQLSNKGKHRRLHALAIAGLAHFDLRNPEIEFHRFDTNLLYRVTTRTGERFILRLAYPGWRTYQDLASEAMWLAALKQDTDIPIPEVIPNRSGGYVLSLMTPGISKAWHMTLMRWLPGRLLGKYLTERNLEKMGVLFARLHQHSGVWTPPNGFSKRRFNHWLSRGEKNLVIQEAETGIEAHTISQLENVPADQRDWLEKMHQLVESAYTTADPSDLRVIHCDLWHDNIKLYKGVLYPFDFEDTVWGYRAHDIAMAMLDLLETVGEESYPILLSAFRRGYQSLLSWPQEPIEPFQIGRLLWKINWVARYEPSHLSSMIARHIPVFKRYTQTGKITIPASQ